ncbi:MAG TPA: ABC transporter substrate-binding protein [Anaerolineae bacterium]|nr:ABC transporter substrate-binding protein [Anaerolineae bacterium]
MQSKVRTRLPSLPAILSLVTLVALLLAACGGTQQPGQPTAPVMGTPGGTETPQDADTTFGTREPGAAQDAREGVLRVTAFPIAQTDPALISSDAEVLIASQVYDYLVDVDASNEIQPRLATDWTQSEDGLTYTFALAEGVAFHDGSPFTAEDVVWTFDRLRDPDSGYPTVDLYRNIVDIQATGDLEVTFTLSDTNPFFLYDLSDNHALVMKAGTEDPTDWNGTGPFVVNAYQPESRIEMQANDSYFVEGQPRLAELQILFFSDQSAAADAVRGGQADLTMDLSTPLYESLSGQAGLQASDIATNQFAVVRLRTDQPPGDDPQVVQAFKLATDLDAIFQLVQQGYGAVGRNTPIGPVYEEYYTEDVPIPARDPEAARQLLADAGYPEGLEIDLNLLDTLNFPDLAVVLKEQWAEAGIDANVVTLPESVYYGENQWLEVPLGITGWGHRPYPQFYLDVMLTCDAIWNEARFCDPEFDRLAAIAGSSPDEQERVDAYHEIQRILIEEGPIIVPYFFAEYAVIRDGFDGFELHPFSGRTDLRRVGVAQ